MIFGPFYPYANGPVFLLQKNRAVVCIQIYGFKL